MHLGILLGLILPAGAVLLFILLFWGLNAIEHHYGDRE